MKKQKRYLPETLTKPARIESLDGRYSISLSRSATSSSPFSELQWKSYYEAREALRLLPRASTSSAVRTARDVLLRTVREYRVIVKQAPREALMSANLVRNGLRVIMNAYSATECARQLRIELKRQRANARQQRIDVYSGNKVMATSRATVTHPHTGRLINRGGGWRTEPGWFLKALKEKQQRALFEYKKPWNATEPFVGIEIECFGEYDKQDMATAFTEAGLAKYVSIGSDGSISWSRDVDEGRDNTMDLELRVLIPQREVSQKMPEICAVLKRFNCRVNKSCGLHVHLDCRNTVGRDVKQAFRRLSCAQNLFFAMVPQSRRDNQYCRRTKQRTFPQYPSDENRYQAINPVAYARHKTLEVRLHSGTVSAEKITRWVELLVAVADGCDFQRFPRTLKTLAKGLKLSPELTQYIAGRCKAFSVEGEPVPFMSKAGVESTQAESEGGEGLPIPAVSVDEVADFVRAVNPLTATATNEPAPAWVDTAQPVPQPAARWL